MLFSWLLPACDDQGRVAGDADALRRLLFPHLPEITTAGIETALQAAESEALILRYTDADGQALTQVTDWHLYQGRLRYKRPSDYEPPSGWRDVVTARGPGSGGAAYYSLGTYDAVVCPSCGVQDRAARSGDGWLCRGCGVELTGVKSPRPKIAIGRTRLAGKGRRAVLVALALGPMTKRELADHTGLVVRSLDAILAALCRDGKVTSERGDSSRSPWVYSIVRGS